MKDTMIILCAIAGVSALYCFVVGEITRNNSQMDKLWSILPIVYLWVIAIRGGMSARLVIMAVLVTLWGVRLTYNFGRKGAYSIKFWTGEEDYRWPWLRETKYFKSKLVWAIFDLLFISIYQNALVLALTFPAVLCMESKAPLGVLDIIAAVFMLGFIIYETIADEQQWKFQETKWGQIKAGKKLEELDAPYNKGYNTVGLWGVSRHPNYLGEQGTWIAFYVFTIAAGAGIINWTIVAPLLLVALFQGSSWLGELISRSKYPAYADYCKTVSKFFPFKGMLKKA